MDAILNAQLQRIETALNTLIDSIITFNPSITAADELLQADDELSSGLEQLTRHQDNYRRITQLRHEVSLLDTRIKSSVQLLADTRSEIARIPLDVATEDVNPVPIKDLLAYATKVGEFTIPANLRAIIATAEAEKEQERQALLQAQAQQAQEDGQVSQQAAATADQMNGEYAKAKDKELGRALDELSPGHKAYLDNLKALPYIPWPTDDDMNRPNGALLGLNKKVAAGIDPTKIEEEDEVDKMQAAYRPDRPRAQAAAATTERAPAEQKKKAMFGLDDDDDDDED